MTNPPLEDSWAANGRQQILDALRNINTWIEVEKKMITEGYQSDEYERIPEILKAAADLLTPTTPVQ